MKIRTLLGLAALGGAYYAHRRRGGELTLDSMKDSLVALREAIGDSMQKVMSEADARARDTANGRRTVTHDADIVR